MERNDLSGIECVGVHANACNDGQFKRGMAIRFMLTFDIHKRRAFPLRRCFKPIEIIIMYKYVDTFMENDQIESISS